MELIFTNKFIHISNKYLHNIFNDIEVYPTLTLQLLSNAFNAEFKIIRLCDTSNNNNNNNTWQFSWTVIYLNKNNNYRTIGNIGYNISPDIIKTCLDILIKDLPILIKQNKNNPITVKCISGYLNKHILTNSFADDCLDLIDHWPFDT